MIEDTAAAVLVAHQRRDIGSCLCRWSELGRSHPEHQVRMLAAAGVLATGPTPARPADPEPDLGAHLDQLPRAELDRTELGAMPADLAGVLDTWLHTQHGVTSGAHCVGAFLDELAAAGYQVTATPGPTFEDLLPPATD